MSHPKPHPPSGSKPGKPGKPKPRGGKPHHPGPGTEIPEPSTWALLLGGGALLA
ncbi:MAG: PEP-CTERM sorting domain-containing protein [Acidobacteria bacterium]|nr:PEP-CTERM sorting domain-containing protein [Acidobacteriota bacterium]